jgi:hypothetical protein
MPHETVSILVCTSGQWRSRLIGELFSHRATVRRVDPLVDALPPALRSHDVILWEWDITCRPPAWIDERKLFIFDYRDNGNRADMNRAAEKWRLKPGGYLAISAPSGLSDVGCLPLPPPALPKIGLRAKAPLATRPRDTLLLCAPTYLCLETHDGQLPHGVETEAGYLYPQRLEWAERLSDAGLLQDDHGLVAVADGYLSRDRTRSLFGFQKDLFRGPLPRRRYLRSMAQSKLVFAPAGHARWTYRHFEGMGFGSYVVSTDLRGLRTMPQLPLDAMELVPDGELDPQRIRDILKDIASYQDRADRGFDFVQQTIEPRTLWKRGGYRSLKAKEIFEQFMTWIDSARHRPPISPAES